jgi:hypothetical protein
MFTCDIGARQRRNFEKVVEDRHKRRYGELFEVSFKPLSAIMADIDNYNSVSACALRRFNSIMNPPSASKASASSSRRSPPRSPRSKKGGNKSKRNRSHERAYDRRHNKSYKQYSRANRKQA